MQDLKKLFAASSSPCIVPSGLLDNKSNGQLGEASHVLKQLDWYIQAHEVFNLRRGKRHQFRH
jgi:hypothetical protein